MNIHFICRGNVLRSLIAETYVKSLENKGITAASSGTNVDWSDPLEREYFANTLNVLDRHGIKRHAKLSPDQLTSDRLKGFDTVVFMNQRVVDEADRIIILPANYQNWGITDIGEGDRTDAESREKYEEEIYREIVSKVDQLIATTLSD